MEFDIAARFGSCLGSDFRLSCHDIGGYCNSYSDTTHDCMMNVWYGYANRVKVDQSVCTTISVKKQDL